MKHYTFIYIPIVFWAATIFSIAEDVAEKDKILKEIIKGYQKNVSFFKSGKIEMENYTLYKDGHSAIKDYEVTFSGNGVRSKHEVKQYNQPYKIDEPLPI